VIGAAARPRRPWRNQGPTGLRPGPAVSVQRDAWKRGGESLTCRFGASFTTAATLASIGSRRGAARPFTVESENRIGRSVTSLSTSAETVELVDDDGVLTVEADTVDEGARGDGSADW